MAGHCCRAEVATFIRASPYPNNRSFCSWPFYGMVSKLNKEVCREKIKEKDTTHYGMETFFNETFFLGVVDCHHLRESRTG